MCVCSQTLANSMSVALENARLFDETQRLLKETEQRAAELAIINRVQQGLVSQLDFQSIIDLVGDKIREIFNAQGIQIRLHDPQTHIVTFPYAYQRGQRLWPPPFDISTAHGGFGPHVIRTRQTLVVNRDMHLQAEKFGSFLMEGEEKWGKSWLGVPIIVGDAVIGIIALRELRARGCLLLIPTSTCSRPSPRVWASPCKTPACSTRPSAS